MTASKRSPYPVMKVYWEQLYGCDGYVHLVGRPCLINPERHDSQDTMYGAFDYPWEHDENWGWMRDFAVWSQGENNGEPRRLYAIEPRYGGIHSADYRDIQRMHKAMTKLHKGLDKLEQEWGYAKGFPEMILRVCKVMKIQYIAVKKSPAAEERSGIQYHCYEVGKDAANAIEYLVREWVEAGKVAA